MEIIEFDELDSTHQYLLENVKNGALNPPVCILTHRQTSGIGSRGNSWSGAERGLYFSFALHRSDLSDDLELQSMSIFFGFLFKESLRNLGSKAWLKWPNDLYLGQKKICGILCSTINSKIIVCGIGLNLESRAFENIEQGIIKDEKELLSDFFKRVESSTWKSVFKAYNTEFWRNFGYDFHHNFERVSFRDAILLEDGAISLNGEKIYSNR